MNIQIGSIELYDLLKVKLGEKEAKSLVTFVETEVENKIEQKKDSLVTNEVFLREISFIRKEISSLEVRLSRSIYIVGLIQYLTIVISLIAIVKYILK
jgi:hypothetical protein